MTDRNWRNVAEVNDLPEDIDEAIEETLGWFEDQKTLPAEEFIDELVKTYGGSGYDPGDWDMDRYDSPAAKEIMRRARRRKKEQGG